MGGENSEIVSDTVDVVFESANFLGSSIRKTALALGMRTDASAKFEKDIDPMLTVPAVNRACELVELLGAGEVMDGMIDIINYVPAPVTLPLEPEKINAYAFAVSNVRTRATPAARVFRCGATRDPVRR